MPVWGDSYLDTYLKISLPSQLAAGNLPTLSDRRDVVYRIYTRPQDVPQLETSPVMARLTKCLKTEIIGARQIDFGASHHYNPFNACYRMGMETAARDGAAAVFLTADQVWADGTLSRIISLGDAGFRSVLISGPRLNKETLVPVLLGDNTGHEVITITSRQAAQLSMDHLHPWDRSLFWEADNLGRTASFMYWQVANEGFIMRCFHLHPVLINPAGGFPRLRRTIDGGNFVRRVCPDLNDLYVIQDSDEAMYFSIAPPEQSAGLISRPKKDYRHVVSWARLAGISRHNLYYLSKTIRFHTGDISDTWTAVEKMSEELSSQLIEALDHPLSLALMGSLGEIMTKLISLLEKNPKFHHWIRHMREHLWGITSGKTKRHG